MSLLFLHRQQIAEDRSSGTAKSRRDIMTALNTAQTISECRAAAKAAGLTFKRQNATINGAQAYKFVGRKSGETKISNCTLGSAYTLVCAGDLDFHKE